MHAPIAPAGVRAGGFWRIEPEWKGETVFIIGGGPSVSGQNVELLRGRKVIVINSSCYDFSWVDILFFADWRWWNSNKSAVAGFAGRVITTDDGVRGNNILHLKRRYPPGTTFPPGAKVEQTDLVLQNGLASDRSEVALLKTSMTAAINLAVHLGAAPIVTLGLDGGPREGRTHHHDPHDWGEIAGNWKLQREELGKLVSPLHELGVTLLNASPASSIPFWPIMSLAEYLEAEKATEMSA